MKFRPLLLTVCLLAPFAVRAQETSVEPLYVLRPVLHAEQEQAELCLEFDHNLDGVGAIAHPDAALHLELDGKTVVLAHKNISLASNQICLAGLEHRKNYRLALSSLRDAKGNKLSRPYSLSFKVPERSPSLAFTNQNTHDGITRWRDNPTLGSVNSGKIKVELYRITDPAKMAEAWSSRLQTALAPSESLYFAKHNGALIWSKDILPDATADKNIAITIDMTMGDAVTFVPGLYLIAASANEDAVAKAKPSLADKSEAPKDAPQLLISAAWLLRSDLDVQALKDSGTITALTEKADASAVAANIRLMAMSGEPKMVAEARSDATGKAVLPPASGDAPKTLVALDDQGNAAFADLTETPFVSATLPPLVATLAADQTIYAPDDAMFVTLSLHDLAHHPRDTKGSFVQMLRPDRTLYNRQPVTLDANGNARLSFNAPVPEGLWHLVWATDNGAAFAETDFRINPNPMVPQFTLNADHPVLSADGLINLTVHSRSAANLAVPYVAGRVDLVWRKVEHPFAAWKDYVFDDGKAMEPMRKTVANFVTDDKGAAHIDLKLSAPDKACMPCRAEFQIVGDAAGNVIEPQPLLVPVAMNGLLVGISPSVGRGYFPENSTAHFNVITLDGDGKPRAMDDDASYQVFEQGRIFEWYHADGIWNYKPQQQRRRIGGGTLAFDDHGRAGIDWPVTSGAYQIDVSDADGKLLTHLDFNAGWRSTQGNDGESATLALKATPNFLHKGEAEKITFTLPHPAIVTASVADDHIRQLIHQPFPAGENTLSFVAGADWGDQLLVSVAASYGVGTESAEGQIHLTTEGEKEAAAHAPVKQIAAPKILNASNFNHTLIARASQIIAAHQTVTLPGSGKDHAALIAPVALTGLPEALSAVLQKNPLMTKEIAEQAALLTPWRDLFVATGLAADSDIQNLRQEDLMRLFARQNNDGGFPSLVLGGASDLATTGAVIMALAIANDPAARPVLDQAVRWVHHYLENTWYDEKERGTRAATYAALARAGKLDLASLHYFSDTNADKNLSQLATAQMAYAFAAINDKAAANFWLDKVGAVVLPDVWPVLLGNRYYQSGDTGMIMDHVEKQAVTADYLTTLQALLDRAGSWRSGAGKEEKAHQGVLVMPFGDKANLAFRNPEDYALYLLPVALDKIPAAANELHRHIYGLDGSERTGALKRDTTYLVLIEGAWADDHSRIALHDNLQPALLPVTCAFDLPANKDFLGWLADKPPSPVEVCEKSAAGIDLVLARAGNAGNWRVAYLAKYTGGDLRGMKAPVTVPFAALNPDDKDARH